MPAGNYEIDLSWGGDFTITPTGDLLLAQDTPVEANATEERIIRLLLTNPGDDLFNVTWGVGLSGMVDENYSPQLQHQIVASIANWLSQDAAVAQSPAPLISVNQVGYNTATVDVRFNDVTGNVIVLPQLKLKFGAGA